MKKDELKAKLIPLLNNRKELEDYLIRNSNLPGPRGNLELMFALSEVYEDTDTLLRWSKISEEEADTYSARSFLPVCSAVCLGRIYTKGKKKEYIDILKAMSNDGRWRVREGAVFGFQIIGESDFNYLTEIFNNWMKKSNNLEKRAMLAALAHPRFLNKENAEYCFGIADSILSDLNIDDHFNVLKKGLNFTISVFTAANHQSGFQFMEKWIGKVNVIDRIIRENLKKNRVKRIDDRRVEELLQKIEALRN